MTVGLGRVHSRAIQFPDKNRNISAIFKNIVSWRVSRSSRNFICWYRYGVSYGHERRL